jgi:hypothetical protein
MLPAMPCCCAACHDTNAAFSHAVHSHLAIKQASTQIIQRLQRLYTAKATGVAAIQTTIDTVQSNRAVAVWQGSA